MKEWNKIKKGIVALVLTISLLSLPVFAFSSSNHTSSADSYEHEEITQEQVVQWEYDLNQLHREVNLLNRREC